MQKGSPVLKSQPQDLTDLLPQELAIKAKETFEPYLELLRKNFVVDRRSENMLVYSALMRLLDLQSKEGEFLDYVRSSYGPERVAGLLGELAAALRSRKQPLTIAALQPLR